MASDILQRIIFKEWLPDRAPIEGAGLVKAINVLPVSGSYTPVLDIVPATSSALSGVCRGMFGTRDYTSDPPTTYAFLGDATKLYRVTGTTLDDVSKMGGYSLTADNRWEFVKYENGGKVIAAALESVPQKYTLGTSTDFADLGGSPPKFRHIAVWNGFLIGGFTDEGGTIYPQKVKWSALNNPEDWAIAPASTGSDEQIIADAVGDIRKIVSSEQSWFVLCEKSVHRADYIGGEFVFQFNRLTDRVGAWASGSVIQVGGIIYFLDRSGFYASDGSRIIPIGHGKVDTYFLTQALNTGYVQRISVAHDPNKKLIFWAYVSNDNTVIDPYPDRMIVYNYVEQRFSEIRAPGGETYEFIGDFITQETSIDDLDGIFADLESVLPDNLDAPDWDGGAYQIGIVDGDHIVKYMTGDSIAVEIETEEMSLDENEKSRVDLVRPLIDGGECEIALIYRNALKDSTTTGSYIGQETEGHVPLGTSEIARYHRFSVVVGAGENFTKAIGLDVEATSQGSI